MKDYSTKLFTRRSIRLKGYDYTQPWVYFVTVCAKKSGMFVWGNHGWKNGVERMGDGGAGGMGTFHDNTAGNNIG